NETRINDIGNATSMIYWVYKSETLTRDKDRYKEFYNFLSTLNVKTCKKFGVMNLCEIHFEKSFN
ncbi:MAG: hypothetical protein EBZ47_10020, partial [Chlamydiae bacterium]|nr:hypothetical protein [Chlamydiota bacterium]